MTEPTKSEEAELEDLARRRMVNTKESYEVALTVVRAIYETVRADIDQSWVAEWVDSEPWEENQSVLTVLWVRTRPKELWPLIVQFPPSCVVRPLVKLMVPAAGTVGIVASYDEDGTVGVMQSPNGRVCAKCTPDQLTVVAYWRGWTPDKVREVLGLPTAAESQAT